MMRCMSLTRRSCHKSSAAIRTRRPRRWRATRRKCWWRATFQKCWTDLQDWTSIWNGNRGCHVGAITVSERGGRYVERLRLEARILRVNGSDEVAQESALHLVVHIDRTSSDAALCACARFGPACILDELRAPRLVCKQRMIWKLRCWVRSSPAGTVKAVRFAALSSRSIRLISRSLLECIVLIWLQMGVVFMLYVRISAGRGFAAGVG